MHPPKRKVKKKRGMLCKRDISGIKKFVKLNLFFFFYIYFISGKPHDFMVYFSPLGFLFGSKSNSLALFEVRYLEFFNSLYYNYVSF